MEMKEAAEEPATAATATATATDGAIVNAQMEATDPKTTEDSRGGQAGLSKRAQKKLAKQKIYEVKKAEKKAEKKENRRLHKERMRNDWEAKLSKVASEEEKTKMIESRRALRQERMDKRAQEREEKIQRLTQGKLHGQNIVIDLEFGHLMNPTEVTSLAQQIMYCYAVNGRCSSPGHLWLTGCEGKMDSQLKRLPGFNKWIIEKESRSYIEALKDQKENLVYLTADAETILEDLDPKKIYIIGGLVDRNRWKGITMKKAQEQGIQTAKLPIGSYLKMSSSQVLTVNQVVEILLKFLELRDWKTAFFQVIPQRKRCGAQAQSGENGNEVEGEDNEGGENLLESQKKMKMSETDLEASVEKVESDEN